MTDSVQGVLDPSVTPTPDAAPSRPRPDLKIRATRGWLDLNLGEIWRFRDLLLTLAGRDLRLRYKQTALGVIWVLLQPLIGAGVLTLVYNMIAKLSTDGQSPIVFAFVGMAAWNLFGNTLVKTSECLVGNSQLISKVYFPRLILPLSVAPSMLVDFAVALVMAAALMAIFGITPSWQLLMLPLWIALLLMLALGFGLCASALAVTYRDVKHILPVLTQTLLLASPVAFAVSNVPDWLRPWFYLNPLVSLLEGFRWSLMDTPTGPDWTYVGYSALFAIAALAIGVAVFKRMERRFADVI